MDETKELGIKVGKSLVGPLMIFLQTISQALGKSRFFFYKELSSKSKSEAIDAIEAGLKEKWAIVNAGLPLLPEKSLHVKIKRFIDKVMSFDSRRGLTKTQRDNL